MGLEKPELFFQRRRRNEIAVEEGIVGGVIARKYPVVADDRATMERRDFVQEPPVMQERIQHVLQDRTDQSHG